MNEVQGLFETMEQRQQIDPLFGDMVKRLRDVADNETNRELRGNFNWLRETIVDIRNRTDLTVRVKIDFIRDAIFSFDVRSNPDHPFNELTRKRTSIGRRILKYQCL